MVTKIIFLLLSPVLIISDNFVLEATQLIKSCISVFIFNLFKAALYSVLQIWHIVRRFLILNNKVV